MLLLIIGLVVFFTAHTISIVAPAGREALIAKFGEGPYKGIYSLIALLGLVLIIVGYGAARQQPVYLYHPPLILFHLSGILLLFFFPLLLATYLPGRIQSAVKHPMLAATKLWAFAHLLANGTLADVLLFGSFLLWAVADRISLKRRPPRPVVSLPKTSMNDLIVVLGGLWFYSAFVFGVHFWLFGVEPIK